MHPGSVLASLTAAAAVGGWVSWQRYEAVSATRISNPPAAAQATEPAESNATPDTLTAANNIAQRIPEMQSRLSGLEKDNTSLRHQLAVAMGGDPGPAGQPSATPEPAPALPATVSTLEDAARIQQLAVKLENKLRELDTENTSLRRKIAEEIEARKPPPTPGEVATRVIAQRELAFKRTPEWSAISADQIIAKLSAKATAGITPEAAAARVRAWLAMGFVASPFDYRAAAGSIAGMKPGGFFDEATGTFFYQADASLARADSRDVFAGALFPVLLAQNFSMPEVEADNDDMALARRALAQGDASFSRVRFSIGDQLNSNFDRGQAPVAPPPSPNAPQFVSEMWKWSEDAGNLFVQALHTSGGLAAVNKAWQRPPQSSAEILHPEKLYQANPPFQPVSVRFDDTTVGDVKPLFTSVAGEIGAYFLIRTFADVDYATAASEGWTGDRYTVWPGTEMHGDHVLWRSVWSTPEDATQFFDAMRRGLMQRHQIPWQKEYDATPGTFAVNDPHRVIHLQQKGLTVTLINATDTAFAKSLIEKFPAP